MFDEKRVLLNSAGFPPLFATDSGFCIVKGTILKSEKDWV